MHAPRILIADDEQHILKVLSLTLNRGGYDVVTADDGDAAWRAVQHHQPDLIITDQAMPGMTGTELAGRVHKVRGQESLPVLLITARHFAPDPELAGAIAGVMPKPFSPKQVLAQVRDLVGPAPRGEECPQ